MNYNEDVTELRRKRDEAIAERMRTAPDDVSNEDIAREFGLKSHMVLRIVRAKYNLPPRKRGTKKRKPQPSPAAA